MTNAQKFGSWGSGECHISGDVYCSQKCFYLARPAQQLREVSRPPEAPPTFTISRKTTPLEESLPFAQTLRLFYYLLLLPLLLLSNFAVVFFWLPRLFATQPPCCRLAFAPTYAPGAKLAVKMLKMRISVIYQLGRPRLPSPIVVFLPLQRVLLF